MSILARILVKRHKVLDKVDRMDDERHEGIDVCYQSKIITAPSLAGFAFSAR